MGCPRKPALRYHMIGHRRAVPWVSFICRSVSRPTASCFCAIPKLFAAICVSHIKHIPLGECTSHCDEKPGCFPRWSRYLHGFSLGAFKILDFKCTYQVPLPWLQRVCGASWWSGMAPHSPSKPWEEQRSWWQVQLLPAALGFLFLCAFPSSPALPTRNRKSQSTLEPLRSCRVTPRLCHVPCVSCAGEGIDTQIR